MNVNWSKKCILMCHPRTGDKDVCEYFGKIGFVLHHFSDKIDDKPLTRKSFSNRFLYPWIYDDFKLVITMDNPYRRIVNEYKRFSHLNWSLKTNTKEDLYIRFNTKFDDLFIDDLYKVDLDNKRHESQYNFLLPYDFSLKKPVHIINVETLINDIYNIDFLDHVEHDFSLVDQIDLSDKYKDVFSYENARVIYKTHRHIFDLMGYDPFSFTTRDLTQKERIHFIHY